MIPTYNGVLSAIEKILQELVKKYWGVRKSLQDLVEGQERNMAQLIEIRATMKQKQGLEGENKKKENRDEEERSEDGPGKSQEERTPLSVSC